MTRVLSTIVLLTIGFFSHNLFADKDAEAVITRFHDSVITMMKTEGYGARLAFMNPVIKRDFDTRTIASVSLGRHWKTLSDEEQDEITELLVVVLASGYASRLPPYSDHQFEICSSTPIIPDRTIIKCKLTSSSDTMKYDYQLVEHDGQWKIFDIVVGGVSDLAAKRGSYIETFAAKGLEGVIAEIEQSIINNSLRYDSIRAGSD